MNFPSSLIFFVSAFAIFTLPVAFACEDGVPCGKPSCPEYLRSLKRKQSDSNEPTFQAEKVQRVPLPLDSASLTSPTQKEIERAVAKGKIEAAEELLQQVAVTQSISEVSRYLELYPQILELENEYGSRLPHFAAEKGHVGIIRLLLNNPVLHSKNKDDTTAIHAAASSGQFEVVQLLMTTRLIMSINRLGQTALHLAAHFGHTEVVKLLMNTRLLMSTDHNSQTALHYAALNGQAEVVKLLMNTPLLMSTNQSKQTALHYATSNGQAEVVKLLMNTPLLMSTDFKNQTALHYAASNGQAEVVKLLMNTPLLELLTSDGYNAFHLGAVNNKIEVVKLLLNTPLVRQKFTDENSRCNAIHLAVIKHYPEVAILLLLSEPDLVFEKILGQFTVENPTFRDSTPLEIAQEPSRAQSFKEFIELAQSLIAFKDGNVAELVQHIKSGKAWSPLLFANSLARTPLDRTALNKLRGSIQETIFSLEAEFDIKANQRVCKLALGLISSEQAVIAPCYSAQFKEVLKLVQARLMGSLQDGCARALALGLQNWDRYYTSKNSDRLQATPYNSFSGDSSYIRTASILLSNLVPSHDGTAARDLCEIWKSIPPADRLFADPKGFAETILGNLE
jgi:ankyrin repeat protein